MNESIEQAKTRALLSELAKVEFTPPSDLDRVSYCDGDPDALVGEGTAYVYVIKPNGDLLVWSEGRHGHWDACIKFALQVPEVKRYAHA